MVSGGNLVVQTLGTALGAMWGLFWPILVPLIGFALIALAAYIIRKATNVG